MLTLRPRARRQPARQTAVSPSRSFLSCVACSQAASRIVDIAAGDRNPHATLPGAAAPVVQRGASVFEGHARLLVMPSRHSATRRDDLDAQAKARTRAGGIQRGDGEIQVSHGEGIASRAPRDSRRFPPSMPSRPAPCGARAQSPGFPNIGAGRTKTRRTGTGLRSSPGPVAIGERRRARARAVERRDAAAVASLRASADNVNQHASAHAAIRDVPRPQTRIHTRSRHPRRHNCCPPHLLPVPPRRPLTRHAPQRPRRLHRRRHVTAVSSK